MQAALQLAFAGSGKIYLDNVQHLIIQMQLDEENITQEKKR